MLKIVLGCIGIALIWLIIFASAVVACAITLEGTRSKK